MITKGVIKTINYSNNTCTVRIPLFETAGSSGEVIFTATFMIQPGIYNGYSEGDVVFVDFEDNKLSYPIIIGKLFKGATTELANKKLSSITASSLQVSKDATIPLTTKLSFSNPETTRVKVDRDYSNYKTLLDIIKAIKDTGDSIENLTKDVSGQISEIKTYYLEQADSEDLPDPIAEDSRWSVTKPSFKDGFEIWQKTVCYNNRGQVLSTEIICLTEVSSVVSYWLNINASTFTGKTQTTAITIKALAKIGSKIETTDETSILKVFKATDSTNWIKISTNGLLRLEKEELQNYSEDLLVVAYHNEKEYYSTTIKYMPLNTPILTLTNYSGSLDYDSYGFNKLDIRSTISSTAEVKLNNEELPGVEYNWTLENCTGRNLNTNTITIDQIDAEKDYALAKCTATYTQGEATYDLTADFRISKNRQGVNYYEVDLSNPTASIAATSTGAVNLDTLKLLTQHELTCSYQGDPLNFDLYNSLPTTTNNSQYYVVYTSNNITLNWKADQETPNNKKIITVTSFTSDDTIEGTINYILYKGSTRVAAETFRVQKLIQGNSAVNYELKISQPVHTGNNQQEPIVITGWVRTGSESYVENTSLHIKALWKDKDGNYVYDPASELISSNGRLTVSNFKDTDLRIQTSKTSNFEVIEDDEIITFNPLNTPILDLSNDSDDLEYISTGESKVNSTDTVSCFGVVYYNGQILTEGVTYEWIFNPQDGYFTNTYILDNEIKSEAAEGAEEIKNNKVIASEAGVFTCKATINNVIFKDPIILTKDFTVSKRLQGHSAIKYWLKLSSGTHLGTAQSTPITVTAMQKIGSEGSEDNDELAILWYKFEKDASWTIAPASYTFTLDFTLEKCKDENLQVIATHKSDFNPNTGSVINSSAVYDQEVIDFSPKNSPIITLTEDSGQLNYTSDGKTKIGNDVLQTTAQVLVGGAALNEGVIYSWTLNGCTFQDSDNNQTSAEVSIDKITSNIATTATATCTATITKGEFKGKSYQKTFRVTKSLQGESAVSYYLTLDNKSTIFVEDREASATATVTGTCYNVIGAEATPYGGDDCKISYKIDGKSANGDIENDGTFNLGQLTFKESIEVILTVGDNKWDSKTIDVGYVPKNGKDAVPIYNIDIKNDFATIPTNIINKQIYRSATDGKFNLLDSKYSILKDVSVTTFAARAISTGQIPGIKLQDLETLAEKSPEDLVGDEKTMVEVAKDLVENLETKPETTLPTDNKSYTQDLSTHEITVYKGTEIQEITKDNFIIKLDRDPINLNTLPTDGFLLCEIGGYTSDGSLATDDFPGMHPTISNNVVTNYVTAFGTDLTNVYINYTYYLNKQPIASAKFEMVRHNGPTTYYFDTNVSSIKVDNTGQTATTSISANAYSLTTSTGDKAAFNGYWKYGTNNSASTTTTGATLTINSLNTEVTNYVIELYEDSEYKKLWDRETISVLKDGTNGQKGADATSYWLKGVDAVHIGRQQTTSINIVAMKQTGTNSPAEDTDAIIWWRTVNSDTWTSANSNNITFNAPAKTTEALYQNQDLIILATHDSTFEPDKATTALDPKVYEFETITYSPLDTPVIDLSNDSAALIYTADGNKIGEDTVSSTATLFLNGDEVENTSYVWLLDNCTTNAPITTNNTHLLTNTIDIDKLSAAAGSATCYAFKDKDIKAVVIRSGWPEAKWTQYSIDTDETWDGTTAIEDGEYFVVIGKDTDYKKLHIILGQAIANNNGQIRGKAIGYDDTATKYKKVFSISKQIKGDTGENGSSIEAQHAFYWVDDYLATPNIPENPAKDRYWWLFKTKETWAILDNNNYPTKEKMDNIDTTWCLVFYSSRTETTNSNGTVSYSTWTLPTPYLIKNEDAYRILTTAEGLFGYGQGVYYTPAPERDENGKIVGDRTITIDGTEYSTGKKIPQNIAIEYVAAKPDERKDDLELYIDAEYIRTGALKVEKDTDGDGVKETIFEAGLDDSTVTIGRFDVKPQGLYFNSNDETYSDTDFSLTNNITNYTRYETTPTTKSDGDTDLVVLQIIFNQDLPTFKLFIQAINKTSNSAILNKNVYTIASKLNADKIPTNETSKFTQLSSTKLSCFSSETTETLVLDNYVEVLYSNIKKDDCIYIVHPCLYHFGTSSYSLGTKGLLILPQTNSYTITNITNSSQLDPDENIQINMGGWSKSSNTGLSDGSIISKTTSLRLGKNFSVNDRGILTATSGNIGPFNFTDQMLWYNFSGYKRDDTNILLSAYNYDTKAYWKGDTINFESIKTLKKDESGNIVDENNTIINDAIIENEYVEREKVQTYTTISASDGVKSNSIKRLLYNNNKWIESQVVSCLTAKGSNSITEENEESTGPAITGILTIPIKTTKGSWTELAKDKYNNLYPYGGFILLTQKTTSEDGYQGLNTNVSVKYTQGSNGSKGFPSVFYKLGVVADGIANATDTKYIATLVLFGTAINRT